MITAEDRPADARPPESFAGGYFIGIAVGIASPAMD
jgi:hypothetical protein